MDLEQQQNLASETRVEDVQQDEVSWDATNEALRQAESDEGPELVVEAVKLLKQTNSETAEKVRTLLDIKKEEEPNEEVKEKLKKVLEDAGVDEETLKNLKNDLEKEEVFEKIYERVIVEKVKELGTLGTNEEIMKKTEEEFKEVFLGMPKIQKDFAKYLIVNAENPVETGKKVMEVVKEKGSEYVGENLANNAKMFKEIAKNAYPTKENILLNLLTAGNRSLMNLTDIVTENAVENAFSNVKAAQELTNEVTEKVVESQINAMPPLGFIKKLPNPNKILNDMGIDPLKKEEEINEVLKKMRPSEVAKKLINAIF